MANRNWASGGKIYSMHVSPVLLDCNFIVDSADSAGLGIRSLKGPAIQNVFMHTSATPGAGNSNSQTPNVVVTNPNPAAGTIIIQLADNYNLSLVNTSGVVSALSGSALTSTTVNVPCVITSLGSATAAQSLADFRAKGLPLGITPAVGVAFVPTASGTIGHSAAVQIAAATGSGVCSIEQLGNAQLTVAPDVSQNQGYGAYIILQCRDYAGAIANPADGSLVKLSMLLSNSSILVQGE